MQTTGLAPTQVPVWQVSVRVQALPSEQLVPSGCRTSAGHALELPVQVSGASHWDTAARQTVPPFPAGCWQATFAPSHWSRVQTLPSLVQAVPLAFFASAGQVGDVPGQTSCTSHSSSAARQTVPFAFRASAGQFGDDPEQTSGRSQSPAAARQTVP
ncbi:MAG TPA: hypothetical protein VNN79_04155 [Actinomycetota bacterium]|nr:hypothetical protein [Actinomycetota bacterium]